MEKTNFDAVQDRLNKRSGKWDGLESIYNLDPKDAIPMWVADMEFKPPQAVQDALRDMLDHGIFGYYGDKSSYLNSIVDWMARRNDWAIKPEWIFATAGLVNGTSLCVQCYTEPGDGVIIFTPVYHVFSKLIKANNRRLVESPMLNVDGRYELDLEGLEASLQGDEKMIVFCSPHNPGGRVWSEAELKAVCDFCIKHDLILVSDEIHSDLVFPGNKHHVMANISDDIKSRLIMMTAGTKTFNMAGGHVGNVIIEDDDLRATFADKMQGLWLTPNSFGLIMTEAAYNHGEDWLAQLIDYLDENRRIFDERVNAISGLKSMSLEATYLAWVDFSGTGMEPEEFIARVEKQARIGTNHGAAFGKGGENFLRFNFALPRSLLLEALDRLEDAFSDLQ
ncbi:MAG: pyridoxal phosphate-dependent aminotransferase [Rhizobiaceae bacterium]|nr:pyridoxal phosphate-dependent aminotransferase [Hyphomicrobiales bacterium]NRB31717.1 pyridoxal phosphate-dependent aminotransferase [Rhizobiaceae bacterium]